MSITTKLASLKEVVSPDSTVLTDPKNDAFQELLKRWSDIDKQTPGAIVLPTSEDECQKIVEWAVDASVPFVTKSGGHSSWSTIGSNGIIIDLSEYSGVEVDRAGKTATLIGGVSTKQAAVALAEEGLFTALGNGNAVGAIPYFLGGGSSTTNGLTGFGSDQIVSARIVTAKGDLLTASGDQNPDLLWAIRGAGQFFGLVTQLVVRAYPFSTLGNDKGLIWSSLFIFPLPRAREVTSVMKVLMDDGHYATSGMIMVMAPPPKRQPSLVVAGTYLGDITAAKDAYKPLYDLGPIVVLGGEVPIQNANDGRAALDAKGGFKAFGTVGLRHFDQENFLKTINLWKELVAECPDALSTAFNFQWDSKPVKSLGIDSAMSHHDIRYWQRNVTWHTDAKSLDKVSEYDNKCLDLMRSSDQESPVSFQNNTRAGPIEFRYRGKERLERLKALKKKWDPTGVFTHQLLD